MTVSCEENQNKKDDKKDQQECYHHELSLCARLLHNHSNSFLQKKNKQVILRSLYRFQLRSLEIVMSPIEQRKVKPKETEDNGDFKSKKDQVCRSKKNNTEKIQT